MARAILAAVNIFVALLIVVVATTVAVVAMLMVRRRAPEGSYFNDGDRAAGVFGVLATGFAVLLGFVVFLAFTSYDSARAGAESEARIVAQQFETAQLLPGRGGAAAHRPSWSATPGPSPACSGERMESGTLGEQLNPWGVALFRTLLTVQPESATEQAAYGKWLDQTSDREEARSDRVHGAVGVIPTPLWIVLFFTAFVIFVYMLFFADSGERAVVQGLLMGTVVSVLVTMLVLLQFLNHPFHGASVASSPTPCAGRWSSSTRSSRSRATYLRPALRLGGERAVACADPPDGVMHPGANWSTMRGCPVPGRPPGGRSPGRVAVRTGRERGGRRGGRSRRRRSFRADGAVARPPLRPAPPTARPPRPSIRWR